jgi:tight adherence protein C
MFGPSLWLDRRKNLRQTVLRRALPDALDVLIICLEGGLSLQASLKRVADELSGAHPQLGAELRIVDREIQLGLNAGEALLHFAQRTNLEEALSLSSVVGQSERFDASLVKSLRSHSETLRVKRKQKAEERAQKAATKMLIPTLLFIFPAVFVILLAPAVIQVQEIFAAGKL